MDTNLINRKAVKEFALKCAVDTQKAELTRVSADFLVRANAALVKWIQDEIVNHPVDGKTIR